MFSLIRIPCILVATVGLHISNTAPSNPPPTDEEKIASTRIAVLVGHPLVPLVNKGVGWSAAFAEIAVILANYAPSSPISQSILSSLIFANGSAERIRMSPLFFAGSFLVTLGGWIRYRCYKALGTMFTFRMSIRKNDTLVTSGPYSVVRHPAYTGVVAMIPGLVLLHGTKGSWLRESGVLEIKFMKIFTAAYIGLLFTGLFGAFQRTLKEDEAMHQRYGKEWEDWARRVPYRLIPWLF